MIVCKGSHVLGAKLIVLSQQLGLAQYAPVLRLLRGCLLAEGCQNPKPKSTCNNEVAVRLLWAPDD